MMTSPLVGCCLDYVNSVLLGDSTTNIKQLQGILKISSRVATRQHSFVSVSDTHEDLHWLPVSWRIDYNIATFTYKVLETGQPLYLESRINISVPRHTLRSSVYARLLAVPPSVKNKDRLKRVPVLSSFHLESFSVRHLCCYIFANFSKQA